MDDRKVFGNQGENLAKKFLEKKGFRILVSQYRCVFGELDLVCEEKGELVFVEVKSRNSNEYGYPEEAVTRNKLRHIVACADFYINEHKLFDKPWRVDVIAIEYYIDPPRITHIEALDTPEHF